MNKDCLDILKENLYTIASSDQKADMEQIFDREIEVPISGCFDIEEDEDYYCIEDYITEETKRKLGFKG